MVVAATEAPIVLYAAARDRGLRPVLLESLGPPTPYCRRTVLAAAPAATIELRGGRLFADNVATGDGIDGLFERLADGIGGLTAREPRARDGDSARGDHPVRGDHPGRDHHPASGEKTRSSVEQPFFPAWLGFFAYEFARHLGLPTGTPMPGLPEAGFRLYRDGWLWEGGRLVSRPPSDSPLAAIEAEIGLARVEDDPESPADGASLVLPEPTVPPVMLESDFTAEEFVAGVDEVQERIRQGWVYQVNLSHRFRFPAAAVDPLACYRRLRIVNPSPFMGLIEGDGWAVVSGSPERLYSAAPDGVVTARPIAGTRPRGATPGQDRLLEDDLRGNVKEQAEHVMLVDLLRNDLSRVCAPGTVEVSEAFTVERYSHVMHLVSEVRGRLDAGPYLKRLADLTAAIFPGGTITGAPKESVMREIARLEPVPRGAYTGALGYVSRAGVDFNILIRSLTFADDLGFVSAGGGIVIGSDAPDEYLETRHKAEALLHVLGSGAAGEPAAPPAYLRSWRPPPVRRRVPAARVVFVEAHDSFSFNIVNYLEMVGARVGVVDHALTPDLGDATHVVVGPGPGEPATSGRMLDWIRAALDARVPLLGVCLGHQALGLALGARLVRAPRPVHGEDHEVLHTGRGLFAGLPTPVRFTRYHSLCLTGLPARLRVDARAADGTVMAITVEGTPAWGVQFHPESMLSPHGLDLLTAFLEQPGRP